VLVVSQMALTTTLLVCSTLLVRSVIHLQSTDTGFDPKNLYAISLRLPASYGEAERSDFFLGLLERTRSLPGVETATIASGEPPSIHGTSGVIQVEHSPAPPNGATGMLKTNDVERDYFRVMGIRLLEGTTFTDTTRQAGQLVINRGLARKYWNGQSAVGRRLRIVAPDGSGDWLTVVGVVDDAATAGLTEASAEPILYRPTLDVYSPSVIVRAKAGTDIATEVRALVRSLDPRLIPPTLVNIEDAMARSAERPRFTMTLLAAFSVAALALASVGLYGVMAFTVAQRTREIGIRMALGATRLTVGRSIVGYGLRLAAIGALLGTVGGMWGTRLLDTVLYGVTRTDPASLTLALIILAGTAAAACVIPSSRAARVDPTVAMRSE
jgi:putative ABC transport system permease protein